MADTHFSGPLHSAGGFVGGVTGGGGGIGTTVTTTAALPDPATATGQLFTITDDGVGDNETALVWSDGTSWLKVTTTALT